MNRRRWLVPVAMGVVALLAIGTRAVVYSAYSSATAHPRDLTGQEWDYTVQQDGSGRLLVSIHALVDDPVVREEYARRAREEALELATKERGDVPVQLTLARPLAVDEAQALATEVGLVAEHATWEARDAAGELATVGARAADGLLDEQGLAPGLEMRALRLVGVVMLQGRVPASGLASLAGDPRVYIVDTLHRGLAEALAESYGVGIDDVEVSAPSPFWSLSAERLPE